MVLMEYIQSITFFFFFFVVIFFLLLFLTSALMRKQSGVNITVSNKSQCDRYSADYRKLDNLHPQKHL